MHSDQTAKVSQSMSRFRSSAWLSLPTPIRVVFDRFPIITYNDNDLPQRVSTSRSQHTLYIFTYSDETFSPNPACLKWQLYLMINNIPFSTRPSNNHASPTGALPFLLPSIKSKRDPLPQAISSTKLQRWAETQGAKEEDINLKFEAYSSLIDQNIRNAWLYHLYLCPPNFESIAKPLYITTSSSNTFVRAVLASQLRAAAQEQLLRTSSYIDAEEIHEQADAAFAALSTFLGQDRFFANSSLPRLFDVSLVAFTHLIIAFSQEKTHHALQWSDDTLFTILNRYKNLVQHRDRVIAHVMEINAR